MRSAFLHLHSSLLKSSLHRAQPMSLLIKNKKTTTKVIMDSGTHKIIVNIMAQNTTTIKQLKVLAIIWFLAVRGRYLKLITTSEKYKEKNQSYSHLAITSHSRLYEDDKLSNSKWMHWKKEGRHHQLLSSPVRSGSLPSSSHVSWRAPELAV